MSIKKEVKTKPKETFWKYEKFLNIPDLSFRQSNNTNGK